MHALNENDYKLFKSICKLPQKSLMKTLYQILKKKYDKIIFTQDYIFAQGEIPIALVAHMDTVFNSPPTNIYYDREAGVIWSPEGGCGDDRAGVFAILKIIQGGLKPSIIFTTDEEQGGIGAEALVKDHPIAPIEIRYIIELDRRGTNDCVFYECDNPSFVSYIETFGFIENLGSFSDISEICPAWGIAGVNLSIGYFDEHSVSETLHVNPLLKTISQVKKMLTEKEIPTFEYIPSAYPSYWRELLKQEYAFEDDYLFKIKCSKCGAIMEDFEAVPVQTDQSIKYYCPDCCVNITHWCEHCGEPFIPSKDSSEKLCFKCRKELEGGPIKCNTTISKNSSMM